VDHYQRRRLMVAADVGRASLLAVTPALAGLSLWTVYPIVLVLYGLTLLFDTAARAAVPDVVPPTGLQSANAILNSIDTAGDLFYVVGGALVALLAQAIPFYVDAASFLFSAAMVAAMRIPSQGIGPLPRLNAVTARIREGIRYVLTHPFLKWTTLVFAVAAPFAGGGVIVLTPLYATHALAATPGLITPLRNGVMRFSLLEVTLGIGALVGGVAAMKMGRGIGRGLLLAIGTTAVGLCYAALAFTQNLYVASIITAGAGFYSSLFVVTGLTLTQTLTPSELRGRVVAARLTVTNASLALGSAAAGIALLVLTYAQLWLILGGILVLAGLVVWLRPVVRSQP
jgi:MFS family permease